MNAFTHLQIFQQANGDGPYECFFCGHSVTRVSGAKRDSLVIHHRNGDHDDNRKRNLVPAHFGCHSSHHALIRQKGKPVNPAGVPLKPSHRAAIAASLVGNQRAKGKHWKLSSETRSRQCAFASSEEGRRIRSEAAKKRWAAARGGDA